jgi:hypothetical protein
MMFSTWKMIDITCFQPMNSVLLTQFESIFQLAFVICRAGRARFGLNDARLNARAGPRSR